MLIYSAGLMLAYPTGIHCHLDMCHLNYANEMALSEKAAD